MNSSVTGLLAGPAARFCVFVKAYAADLNFRDVRLIKRRFNLQYYP